MAVEQGGGLTRDGFEERMRGMPRDVVTIVEGEAMLARLVEQCGRRAVLVSRELSMADGLTVVEDMDDLESRFFDIGAPEAYVMATSVENADRFESLCKKTRLNYSTGNRRAKAWVEYTTRNARHAALPSLQRLVGKLDGVPAFVVGAGPSLDKNRHLLEQAKERGIVIGVNAAGAALPVAPHITMSIEAEDTRGLLGDMRDSIRCLALSSYPAALDEAADAGLLSPCYVTNPSGALKSVVGLPRLETSISASTTATSLALLMGCSPIVLVGQDLAYPGGKTYAEAIGGGSIDDDGRYQWGPQHQGSAREHSPLPETERLIEVESWGGGGTVKSSMPWATVASYWGNCARVWEGVGLINCTEGGARVPGWAEAPLGWLLEQLSTKAPTTSDLLGMMSDAGPLVPSEQMEAFLAAQSVAARTVALRASDARVMAEHCARTYGQPPLPVGKMIDWVWDPCPWAKSWTERAVNEALVLYQRLPPLPDSTEEDFAGAWALASACEVIEQGALELSEYLRRQA